MTDSVNHPSHYGGEDNPYEVIKVAEAWGFDKDAYLFNVLKYIARPGKGNYLEDLKKAAFYLNRKIEREEPVQEPADEHYGPQQYVFPLIRPGYEDHGFDSYTVTANSYEEAKAIFQENARRTAQ